MGARDFDGRPVPNALPGIRLTKTSAQVISAATWTRIVLNSVIEDTGGMSASSGVVTVPTRGWYQINGNCTFAGSVGSARRIVALELDGTYRAANVVASAQGAADPTTPQVSDGFYLDAGDTVALVAWSAINWSLDVSQPYMTALSVVYLGV